MAGRPIQLEIDQAKSRFVFHQSVLAQIVAGPVTRDLARRAVKVESAAKINASQPHRGGVPNSGSEPGKGPAVRTGRLRGSITWRLGRDAIGPYADIGSAVFYAAFVELGTSKMEARPFLRPALAAAAH